MKYQLWIDRREADLLLASLCLWQQQLLEERRISMPAHKEAGNYTDRRIREMKSRLEHCLTVLDEKEAPK